MSCHDVLPSAALTGHHTWHVHSKNVYRAMQSYLLWLTLLLLLLLLANTIQLV